MRRLVHRKRKRARSGPAARHKMFITKGDRVRVIAGEDKGKEGTVLRVDRKRRRVVVEGVRIQKRHRRAKSETDEGGIIEVPGAIDASNVMLLDPKSGEPTRVRTKVDSDGTKERIAVRSGEAILRR